ncbi:hypothetical protein LJC38_06105 [Parabacteroides sp. OttesenSCG-928-K15]|nr:hypothetical protein [Parabacteroides sp. OttesenSCG-928-K15]
MYLKRKQIIDRRWCLIGLFGFFFSLSGVWAQLSEDIFADDYHLNPEKNRELSLDLNTLSFFKNIEYDNTVIKGYSLPGLWLQPKVTYYPLPKIKLEAGLHVLLYHGSYRYPNVAYHDIAEWKGTQYQKGAHFVSYFRAQMQLTKNLNIILGQIYGGANHQLIEPMYSSELNLTADPEAGVQLLWDSKNIHADLWLDWHSFIYKEDTHQEAFTFGISSRFGLNDPASKLHFYLPFQFMAQHRGGELDTMTVSSVSTFMNAATGIGAEWTTGKRVFRRMNFDLNVMGYYQQAGNLWPLDNGYAGYARITADIGGFQLKTAYFYNRDFVSLYGNPLFGAMSLTEEYSTYKNPQMFYLGGEYTLRLGKGYALGVDFDLYHLFADVLHNPETGTRPVKGNTNFSFGVYLRVHPSFLLKKF